MQEHQTHVHGWLWQGLWLTAALLACLTVALVNGRPLFYFDTGGYVVQGTTALEQLHLIARPAEPVPASVGTDALGAEAAGTKSQGTVDGSRSAAYAVITGLFVHFASLSGIVGLNAVLTLVAVWLPMRIANRLYRPGPSTAALVAVPVLVAALGSLSFYVAYLMPDVFTPILILMIATLSVFARQMRGWELALVMALGALAIVAHLSHIGIAVLMVPVALVTGLALTRRRWWLPGLCVVALVAIGYGERQVQRATARTLANSEVILKPFLAARIIQDGPGLAYLNRHCPDASIDTCKLHAALQLSDDPYRLTASHILFETSTRLGSFQLMTPEDQRLVARAQFRFFVDVLKEAPFSVTYAVLKNTLIQARMFSVTMTLPSTAIVTYVASVPEAADLGILGDGRLTVDTSWLTGLTAAQRLLYLLTLATVVGLCLLPGQVPAAIRLLALVLMAGILANAVVCGAVSQPAMRYGARVIWLLPFAAAMLVLFAGRRAAR